MLFTCTLKHFPIVCVKVQFKVGIILAVLDLECRVH